ncbi:succinylglutamate-semialdehyde dehydrogenase [Hyphobacterium sp. SN044]|uniref:succinylglutamate-semialdehyde dehydrogenase n=1 Tax=Hyphobacterium sp. SN044 TaxID=2912575 RepID=UPI001F00332C|nr:succinylglutamate-semialdehyde dehydrogenase [Hyphobacterium sp. SN044]MCF8879397.1 succinylglutamate-semialdehyde dehydrogenase [Hyphobacterium sp. SN044]
MQGQCFIDGEWRSGRGGSFTSTDPASGETVWQGAAADAGDVDAAFTAARKAFPGWAQTPLKERVAIVERFGALLAANKDRLAELIARETGKVLWDSQGEAAAMAGKIAISVKAYHERTGEQAHATDFGEAVLRHKPLGVMFVLGPYNFPGHLPNGHIVPALIAGNTAVFKPSELTPAVGQFMVSLWQEAGLPAGVLNFVPGARETGAAALDHDQLDGVLFTGSHATGQFIHRKFAGRTGVQLALEMGGNNPLVVWDAEDAEAAARIAVHSAYITTGQRCSCARRLILPDGAAGQAVIDAIADLAGRLTIGAWNDAEEAFMGPLVSGHAAGTVLKAQDKLISGGGKAIVSAARLDRGDAFVSPALIDVTGMDTGDDEVFGPMLQVCRVASFDAAMTEANNTAYGLSAGLVSDDEALWNRFWTESRAGIVNRNRPTPGAASSMPFGGPGQSGNLRPSAYYAADYCAYPVASQNAAKPERLAIKGLK